MSTNNLPGNGSLSDLTETAGQRVTQVTQDARAAAADMARSAGSKVEDGRIGAANQLEGAASAVRQHAAELPGGPRVQQFAHRAADGLTHTADYLRTADARRLRGDVETIVRDNPGPALLVAAVFGFLVARSLTTRS